MSGLQRRAAPLMHSWGFGVCGFGVLRFGTSRWFLRPILQEARVREILVPGTASRELIHTRSLADLPLSGAFVSLTERQHSSVHPFL